MRRMTKIWTLYALPERFYRESGSAIGALYERDGRCKKYTRTDYGKVKIAVERGTTVVIKPAPENLKTWAAQELARLLFGAMINK